jgi:hypothetical protein
MRRPFQIGSLEHKLYERLIRRASPELAARIDRWIPPLKNSWGGPFNAQPKRAELFRQIIGALPLRAIVETGTFRGTTTEFLRKTSGLDVFTVESSPRFYHYNVLRFQDDPGVSVSSGDSRRFLEQLAEKPDFPKEGIFFYLDAHWAKDLPLREEVEIIARRFRASVIMIDDFQVPDDAGYRFDDYGPGKRLSIDYLPLKEHPELRAFWPAARSSEESGARRGCVVLSVGEEAASALRRLSGLRSIEPG